MHDRSNVDLVKMFPIVNFRCIFCCTAAYLVYHTGIILIVRSTSGRNTCCTLRLPDLPLLDVAQLRRTAMFLFFASADDQGNVEWTFTGEQFVHELCRALHPSSVLARLAWQFNTLETLDFAGISPVFTLFASHVAHKWSGLRTAWSRSAPRAR